MGDRLLATIIELEKILQEEVCREAERAVAWRERELAMLALEATTVQRQLSDRQAAAQAAARRSAAEEGERLLAAAVARNARLTTLPDAFLEKVLRRQLQALLPEDGDDHPHGQS